LPRAGAGDKTTAAAGNLSGRVVVDAGMNWIESRFKADQQRINSRFELSQPEWNYAAPPEKIRNTGTGMAKRTINVKKLTTY
jgi:hypothetical protein